MDISKRQQFIDWMELRMREPETTDASQQLASALGKFEELFPFEHISWHHEMGTKIVGQSGTAGASGSFWNEANPPVNKF